MLKKSGTLTEKSNFDVFTSRPQRAKERITEFKGSSIGEFPGGPVVRMLLFHCQGPGFHPWLGN